MKLVCSAGDAELLKKLLAADAVEVDAVDEEKRTALHFAGAGCCEAFADGWGRGLRRFLQLVGGLCPFIVRGVA